METGFNHFDDRGNAVMVDVSDKSITDRTAIASGRIRVNDTVMHAIVHGTAKKGDVLGVARVAGIMGTKQTSNLIPMCHPLCLNKSTVDFHVYEKENSQSLMLEEIKKLGDNLAVEIVFSKYKFDGHSLTKKDICKEWNISEKEYNKILSKSLNKLKFLLADFV